MAGAHSYDEAVGGGPIKLLDCVIKPIGLIFMLELSEDPKGGGEAGTRQDLLPPRQVKVLFLQ